MEEVSGRINVVNNLNGKCRRDHMQLLEIAKEEGNRR